jgi:TonB family protein
MTTRLTASSWLGRAARGVALTPFLACLWTLTNATDLKADDLVRISMEKARQVATAKPAPDYPPMAKQLKITGRVSLEVLVALDGSVEKVDVVAGNPVLASAATAAAKKWKFPPFEADGKPMKAVVRLYFDFD